ncbi:MAG: hypothetical protein JXA66_06145 [Oligoflexia bacterium]|nr:hypothetical protein [Oligoflexia bacterium]
MPVTAVRAQDAGDAKSVEDNIGDIESSIQDSPDFRNLSSTELIIQTPDTSQPMELERKLAIKKLYVLLSDNTDGIYSGLIMQALKKYFKNNKRFELTGTEVSKTGIDLFSDEVIKKVSHIGSVTNIDGVLHIRTLKNKNTMRLDGVIYIAKTAERYIQETGVIELGGEEKDLDNKVREFADRILLRLPYLALVTSRFDDKVTIDIGTKQGMREGISLPVYRIVRTVKHPYLGTILSVTRARIGTIKIMKADEWISFARVTEESKNWKVLDSHKIMRDSLTDNATIVLNEIKAEEPESFTKISGQPQKTSEPVQAETTGSETILGHVSPVLRFMHIGYSVVGSDNQVHKSTARFSPGFGFDAELLLTRSWFVEMFFMYQIHTFTPEGGVSSSFNSSFNDLYFVGGYKHYIDDVVVGFKAGFKRASFFTDSAPADSIHTNKRYRGFYTGIFADIPVDNKVAVGFKGYLVFFNGLAEAPGTTASQYDNSIFGFDIYVSYRVHRLYGLFLGMMYDNYRTSYLGTGTTSISSVSSSISNKGAYLGVRFDF